MALNKDVLGGQLKTAADAYNNVPVNTNDPAAMSNYQSGFWNKLAEVVINHFKTAGVVSVTVTTTGTATNHTGSGTGSLS